jgi:hypothetical protein
VQVCRCAGGRFTLRHDDETNTRAGHVSRRKDPLPDKRLPSPRLSRKVCRCAGVQAEDLLSDMMMKQIQGQAMCPGEKIRSQTNVYPRPRLSWKARRCAGVQVEDLLSDMMMKQIQGQARCPGEKIRSRTNVYPRPRPRLSWKARRCPGVQASMADGLQLVASCWSAPVTHSAAWGSNFWVLSKNFCSFGQSTMYTMP